MRIVVVGAGDVGTHIARDLADDHEVVVVDVNGERLEKFQSSLEVSTVTGDGRSLDALEAAGIYEANVVIASTDDDAVNVMVCGAVENVTGAFTIARAKSVELFETWQRFGDALGIDQLLCVDLLTAEALVRTVTLPGALAMSTFVDGQVEMAEFEIEDEAPIAGKSVAEADEFPSLTFAGLLRAEEVHIPSGDTVIEAGDRVVVIGSPSSIRRFATHLSPAATLDPEDEIVVVGGGEVGYQTAQLFEKRGFSPRLVEHDTERAEELTGRLSKTTVLESEATSFEFLEEEGIGDADLLVGTLDDETNYLLSLLATETGVGRTAAIVGEGEYVDLFEAAGVDVAIQPHTVVARAITRATREYTDEAAILERDSAEVLEITVESDSVLAGESIVDATHDLPEGFVIGALVRDGSLTTPRGGTVIQAGDHVVAFVDTDVLDDVAAVL